MAFVATNRVRVTSEFSPHRGLTGSVRTAAADQPDGLNAVQLDGHRSNKLVLLSDSELGTTSVAVPYGM